MAIGAGVVLFGVNNLLLARVLTRLPGGTALAVTDLAVVALVTLETRRIPAIATIYATYGFLGFLGHLGVDALAYGRHLPAVVGAALLYDAVVALHRRRQMGLAVGLPLFVGAILLSGAARLTTVGFILALSMAYGGLACGLLLHRLLLGRRPAPPSPPA